MDNRILVAAARGARLQSNVFPAYEWRAHPDDTELLYCKVGRALRKAAENPPTHLANAVDIDTPSSPLAQFNPYVIDWIDYRDANTETRRMFLLMMAEELSYEVLE